MSQNIINSILKNIKKLEAKIFKLENDAAGKQAEIQMRCDSKVNPLREQIEKLDAMLELLNPAPATVPPSPVPHTHEQATLQEPVKQPVPAFFKGKEHGA